VAPDVFSTLTGENGESPLNQLSYFVGPQLAVLPLCAPEFVSSFDRDQTQGLLVRLEELRKTASNDRQRLWLDMMIQAANQRLGQAAETDAAAKRIANNNERLDARHGKNAAALIAEVRQAGAQMEELRKTLQMIQ
jgi:hypothetical protein